MVLGVVVYKCINCGGPLAFNAESQNWTCDYCLSEFTEQEVRDFISNEEAKKSENLSDQEREEIKVLDEEYNEKATGYSCKSCGAEIVTDEVTAATFCYYCHNPTIIPRALEGDYRPEKVIPFKINKEKAKELFIQWCKKKPLLSKWFTATSQLEKLSGIYVPFWLFNYDTTGKVDMDATKVRTYTRGDTRYTETKFYEVIREGEASFRKVPADGSKKMDDELMSILEPYNYNDLKEFSMSYLSGYFAEKYDMDQNDVYPRVSKLIREYTTSLLRDTATGYSSVRVKNARINFHNVEAMYVLLPVWMFTYQYKGKRYIFAMNGQTGKIAGNLPISIPRAASWFGVVSASLFVILLLGGRFIW